MQTELFSEVNKVDLAVPPLSRAAGTASSSWFPMRDYGRVAGILQFSDIPAGNTIQLVFRQATSSAGAGAKTIAGRATTAIAGALTGAVAVVELQGENLDVNNGYNHVQLQVVSVGATAHIASALLVRRTPRFYPVPLTGVTQVVA
jgi:hypothetical protein